jgi:hypothetical protein
MDVIKVRLQTQQKEAQAVAKAGGMYGEMPYKGFRHAFGKILAEEGYFRGLMKG